MIARLGYFDDFDLRGREYVLEAIRGLPGFRGAYHLVDREGNRALSVSLWDDQAAAKAGEAAVGEARRVGGHGGPSPRLVETWEVVRHTGDGSGDRSRSISSNP